MDGCRVALVDKYVRVNEREKSPIHARTSTTQVGLSTAQSEYITKTRLYNLTP